MCQWKAVLHRDWRKCVPGPPKGGTPTDLRFEVELWFVAENQGIALEIGGFQALQPIADKGANVIDAKLFVEIWIFLEIGVGEFE